jgi:hypothetical protein
LFVFRRLHSCYQFFISLRDEPAIQKPASEAMPHKKIADGQLTISDYFNPGLLRATGTRPSFYQAIDANAALKVALGRMAFDVFSKSG